MAEEILRFADPGAFRAWLQNNHSRRESVWLEFRKGKDGTFSHHQALEEALGYGWIDSLIKRVDHEWYRVKFTQRRRGSNWSQRNKRLVEKLMAHQRMAPPGLEKVREAKASGEWDSRPRALPAARIADLERQLAAIPGAAQRFATATPARRKLLARYYFAAKRAETRDRRLARIADSLETGKPIM